MAPDISPADRERLLSEIPVSERHRWFRSMTSSQAIALSVFGNLKLNGRLSLLNELLDEQGRPIFVPGYEVSVPGGAPDTLLGRPIVINDDIAAMAASARSILAGDFSKYVVRRVMDLTLFRMTDSAFTLLGQVGFVAFQRLGGNLIDAGGAVKYYANSAT